jgi:hypothetical protein
VQQRLSELTQGRVRVLPVPGNHMTMMLDPANATAVGDTLSRPKPPRPPRSASPRASSRRATPAAAATPVEKSPMTEDIVQILALDGTEAVGGTGYVAAALLGDLQSKMTPEQRGNFLNKATIFTGTSAGSANALFLAMAPDPDTALAYIHAFWKESEAVASQGVSPLGFVKTLIGLGAVLSTKKLRGFYLNYFGMLKLGDLPHKVVVPSFKLDDPTDLHGEWRPKVFHNMDANDPDMEELVVDVLMRSSSPPLLTPVYQSLKHAGPGYVDGGVWANNPSMAAIGQVVPDRGNGSTDGIRVLSVSNGTAPLRMTPKFKDGYADLGYVQWLLNPWFVGALVNLLVTSGQMAVEYQGGTFLLDRFQRLNPQLPGRMLQFSSAGIDECVAQILEYDNTIAQVTATLEWLEAIDWYGAP